MADRRLFFALWPSDRQRDAMREIIRPALSSVEGIASERSNWHVTLVFIGNIDEQQILPLQGSVAGITCAPFRLRLDRVSFWPRPKIACLEATRTPDELTELVERIAEAMEPFHVPPEKHRYRPHVTIARNARSFPTEPLARPLELTWSDFELIESISSPRGIQYHPVKQEVRGDS